MTNAGSGRIWQEVDRRQRRSYLQFNDGRVIASDGMGPGATVLYDGPNRRRLKWPDARLDMPGPSYGFI